MKPRVILVIVAAIVGCAICLSVVATASVRTVAKLWVETVANAEPSTACERDRERLAHQLDRYRHMCRGCAAGED